MILLIVKIALHISECHQGEREREIEKKTKKNFPPTKIILFLSESFLD